MTWRIFVVEDHAVMQAAIADLIELEPDLELCGTASTTREALEKLDDAHPDLVLVDVSLPKTSGIDLIRQLAQDHPELRCLVVSGHNELLYAEQARDAGARGFLLKTEAAYNLIPAIRKVLDGQFYFTASLS